jgi:xanthine dehydrogenase molybdopterin-binding subunit B
MHFVKQDDVKQSTTYADQDATMNEARKRANTIRKQLRLIVHKIGSSFARVFINIAKSLIHD